MGPKAGQQKAFHFPDQNIMISESNLQSFYP